VPGDAAEGVVSGDAAEMAASGDAASNSMTGDVAAVPDGWPALIAALSRLALQGGARQAGLLAALALIGAHFGGGAVQVFAPARSGRFARLAASSPPADAPGDDFEPAGIPDDLARADALCLPPGDAFPALPDTPVLLVALRAAGRLAGLLHVAAAGRTPAGPVRDPVLAALGDLVLLVMRGAGRAAEQDGLTGLPNGAGFGAVLARAMPAQGASVLIVDIDNFRCVKTVLGRSVSDALLRALSDRLAGLLEDRATLARSDGDAFSVLVPGGTQIADRVARDLRAAIARPFDLDQITVYVTASIGISRLTGPGEAPEALVRQAEVASFAARTAGGNRQARYTRSMDARLSRRGRVVQALRHALGTDQFALAFQPKFSVTADPLRLTLAGAEALLRWHAPGLGDISPDEFIPIAEASGVITEIDARVMDIFACQMGRWRRAGHAIPASVNLSPRSFEDETLARRLLDALARERVAPGGVSVEITETSLVSMSPAARANLSQMRAAGIALSVDDFGTGYSSLGYLQTLTVSEIKIDKSFIAPLPPHPGDTGTEKIVRTILALAHGLDIRVVAEGVENAAQAVWLADAGCHLMQGYLGGRAVAPEAFEGLYLRR